MLTMMIKMEKIDYLINYLLDENPRIKYRPAETFNEKFNLYRSLSNIRPAKPIDPEYTRVEDSFLNEYLNEYKKTTSINDIDTVSTLYPDNNLVNSDRICIWQGDITTLDIDAIVNAANSQGLGCFVPCHNCIDNQINTFAGVKLRLECNEYMKTIDYNLETGKAFTTKAYNLPAKHVIHTVGPIISRQVTDKDKLLLSDCYTNTLKEAQMNNIKSVAFCSISTGEFHFPKDLASQIAISTVDEYLSSDEGFFEKIVFNVFGNESLSIYQNNIR